jgi:hypothetical protein
MPNDDAPASGGSVEPPVPPASPDLPPVLSLGAQELERVGQQLVPRNLNAEHQQRLNEALVKQQETKPTRPVTIEA